MTDLSKIRNFSIIAHIDHGKSTLADRLLEACNAIDRREMEDQILDSMDLERERGITIKARAVQLTYTADDGETYDLNLIDTPGHVDFSYEVSRSLAACEGAVLVVDASQGVEAQTLANTFLATDAGLEVLPVINKIDLPSARPEEVKQEIEDIIGLEAEDAPEISAKNGINIHAVLEKIVSGVPAPTGSRTAPLQALIFDSQYDSYRGVIVYLRVKEGTLTTGMDIKMMATGAVYKVVEVGTMNPLGLTPRDSLGAGEVGYLTASIKTVSDTRVGDTVTGLENPAPEPLPGYRAVQPMVYSGVYPADGAKYQDLRDALEKLKLNDASFVYEPESSGLRLPLRLSGPAAHGNYSGAAGTGIQPGPHHHRPQRGLPGHENQRGGHHGGQSPGLPGPHGNSVGGGTLREGQSDGSSGICGQHHGPLYLPPGRVQEHGLSGCQPGGNALRNAPERDYLRLF